LSNENERLWVLDIALNEDHSRFRKDQAPEYLAVLRDISLNLLKQEKLPKAVSMLSSYKPVGKKITCSKCSLLEFRCDYPGLFFVCTQRMILLANSSSSPRRRKQGWGWSQFCKGRSSCFSSRAMLTPVEQAMEIDGRSSGNDLEIGFA